MTDSGTLFSHLIVLRGNSGSGKSTAARALRERYGRRLAWVEQDYLRRVVLKELDAPGAANISLIEQTVRYALAHGYIVVLEGILDVGRYGEMLELLASMSQAHSPRRPAPGERIRAGYDARAVQARRPAAVLAGAGIR